MRVQYIGHSGFLVEMEQFYLLFDYYEGELPVFHQGKRIFVFVSHKHQDHYNRDIWKLKDSYQDVCFVLSKEVPFSARQRELLGISEADCKRVIRVRANQRYVVEYQDESVIQIDTFKSTDLGVAYLVSCEECRIYHAGDLNRWVWKGESDDWNQEMTKKYSQQLEELKQKLGSDRISIAFLPVDPRQEEEAFGGICEFLEKIAVDRIFPMHFWKDYGFVEICRENVEKLLSREEADKMISVNRMGQEWIFEDL